MGSFDKSITSAGKFKSAPPQDILRCVAGTLSDSIGIYIEPTITLRSIDSHSAEHDLFGKPDCAFADHVLIFRWSMILTENRFPLFGIML
jgi:hypothetical protein